MNQKTNSPDNIVDAVFSLLGNAAASQGQGDITDTDYSQQATADQAFTNAKVAGMTAALIYRALERNTGKVDLASVACTSIKAVNPEIAAIQQHQDPPPLEPSPPTRLLSLNWPNKSPPLAVILKTPSNLAPSHPATLTTTLEPATPATSRTTPRAASSHRICS